MTLIHPQAIVDPRAELADDVVVGPWTLIGPDVKIDSGTLINSHVVIKGPVTVGKGNQIYQFASVGEACQDKKYKGEPTRLEIGDNNIIRESCTLHRGTVQDNGVTRLGNGNLLMAYVHIAHDCIVGDNNVFANNASLAGHVHLAHDVILGGFSGIHQFCRVGAYSMASMGAMVPKDIPAFVLVSGDTAKPCGMNFEGMKRRGYSTETIRELRNAYKVVYRQGLTLEKAIETLEAGEIAPELALFIESLKNTVRGIVR
jgi:UDP-N-acetylglucosamine acyltransferase